VDEAAVREAVVRAGLRLAAGGLVIGTAGNLSVRLGERVVVTPTGAALGTLDAARLSVVDLDGTHIDGDLAPTSEVPLHLATYRATGGTAIAHAHAPASIAAGCVVDVLPPLHYAVLALGGPVRVAAYAPYGSGALAENVCTAMTERTAALMRNHGSVAYGSTLEEACDRIELVEWLSSLYLSSAAVREPVALTDEQLQATLAAAVGYGSTQPAGGAR